MEIPRRAAIKTAALIAAGSAAARWTEAGTTHATATERLADASLVDLTVRFTGLCVFAVDRDASLPQLGTVYGLLIDSDKLTSGTYPTHSPKLWVRQQDVLQHAAPDSADGEWLQYGLTNQDVRLFVNHAFPTVPATTIADVQRPNKTDPLKISPPYEASWNDIAFVADLDGILGNHAGTIDPKYVQNDLAPNTKVAARVLLAGGALLGGVPSSVWGWHTAWGFNDPSTHSNYCQALTDIVEFHVTQAQSIEIVLTVHGQPGERRIALRPSAVTVKIENVAPTAPHCASSHDTTCPPNHFRAYYELLEQDPRDYHPTPAPRYLCGTDAEVRADPPVYCVPPVGFYRKATS